jgi:uncharacterized protein involved in exopolysaccharide biosynthesis
MAFEDSMNGPLHPEQRALQAGAAGSAAPVDDSHGSDLVEAFASLKRNRNTVFGIALAFLILATATAFLIPVQYASVAAFIPPSSSSNSGAAAIAGQLSALGAGSLLGGVKGSGDLYAGILRSHSISSALVKRFHLNKVYGVRHESDAIKRLTGNTTIAVGAKDTIVTLTVTDRSPERAHDLAQAYLDALHETNGRLALTESGQRRVFFDQQLLKEKDELGDAEVELKKVEEQSGLILPAGQTSLEMETIAKTRAQIAVRQVQLAALRQSSTEVNPVVIRLRSEITDLEGQLNGLHNGKDGNDVGNIPTSKVPALQLLYVRKEREVKYHEALFEMLTRQDEAARMDEAHEAPLLQILDPASYPDQKSWPPRTLIVIGGLFAGTLIGAIWVLGREHLQSARSLFASASELSAGINS